MTRLKTKSTQLYIWAATAMLVAASIAALAFNGADFTTWTTLLAVASIGLLLWLVWLNASNSANQSSEISRFTVTITGVAGIILAFCSAALSVTYGYTMGGNNTSLSVVFAAMLLGLVLAEFMMAFWLDYWIRKANAMMFIVAGVLLIVNVGVSILAQQAMIASQVDAIKMARKLASDEHQVQVAQREQAAARAQQLAVSEGEYQSAKAEYEAAMGEAQSLISSGAGYSDCSGFPTVLCTVKDNYKTMTARLNGNLTPIRERIRKANRVIKQYGEYQGAIAHLESLKATPLSSAANADLPHVVWLSALTGAEPALVEARIYVGLSFIVEWAAILLIFFYGQGLNALKGIRPAVVRKPDGKIHGLDGQLASARTGAAVLKEGLLHVHELEEVLNAGETRALHELCDMLGVVTVAELLIEVKRLHQNRATPIDCTEPLRSAYREKTKSKTKEGDINCKVQALLEILSSLSRPKRLNRDSVRKVLKGAGYSLAHELYPVVMAKVAEEDNSPIVKQGNGYTYANEVM